MQIILSGNEIELLKVLLTESDGSPEGAALLKRVAYHEERQVRDAQIRDLAEGKDEVLEIDDEAIVSEGDDNGAYVQAWTWVSFSGTALDKGLDDDEADREDEPDEEAA